MKEDKNSKTPLRCWKICGKFAERNQFPEPTGNEQRDELPKRCHAYSIFCENDSATLEEEEIWKNPVGWRKPKKVKLRKQRPVRQLAELAAHLTLRDKVSAKDTPIQRNLFGTKNVRRANNNPWRGIRMIYDWTRLLQETTKRTFKNRSCAGQELARSLKETRFLNLPPTLRYAYATQNSFKHQKKRRLRPTYHETVADWTWEMFISNMAGVALPILKCARGRRKALRLNRLTLNFETGRRNVGLEILHLEHGGWQAQRFKGS